MRGYNGVGKELGVWDEQIQANKKDLLFNTGNYSQCLVITYGGKKSEKIYVTHVFYVDSQ